MTVSPRLPRTVPPLSVALSVTFSVALPLCAVAGALISTLGAGGCAKVEQRTGAGTGGTGGGTPAPLPGITGLVSLTITPPSPTIELTGDASGQIVPATQTFTAEGKLNDQSTFSATDRVNWTLAPRTGSAAHGSVTVNAPGLYTVTAASGSVMAQAQLTATFRGNRFGPGFVAANAPKLDGAPSGLVNVAYPLDGAIFPSNFGKVVFQFAKTAAQQDLARLHFVGDGLDLTYYATCDAAPVIGGGCYVTLQSDMTKWFVGASAQRDLTLTARLGSSAGGALAESGGVHLAWADVPLSGGLYYWTTINPGSLPGYSPPDMGDPRGTAVMRYNFSGDMPVREMVWTDRGSPTTNPPFQESPPAVDGSDPESGRAWGMGRCIGCHTISPDGKLMAFSIGGSDASSWAILTIASRTLTLLDPAASTATTGIDALKPYRRGRFATFTTFGPGSDVMVNMYRGKLSMRQVNMSLQVVRDDLFAAATPERKSDPFWSPDGQSFAFTSYDVNGDTQTSRFNGDTKTGGQIWSATADATGPREDAKLIVPRQPGVTSYYPAISHDGNLLVFNKSQCSGPPNPGGYGTGPCDGYDDITAALWLTTPKGGSPVPLNQANGANGQYSNSWPRWSPDNGSFRGQKLYWLAFSSRRPYGMLVNSGAGTGAKPQLWFAAVLAGDEFSQDPSRSPVWLPDQNSSIEQPTGNHVPQWVKFVVPID